jgi:hypothetical protein
MQVLIGELDGPGSGSEDEYEDHFRLERDDSLTGLLDDYAAAASATEKIVKSIGDLGQAVPVRGSVPWFPKDVDA